MILRFEVILSVLSYQRKNIIFYDKNLRKIILLMMFFVIEFFLTITSYKFLKNAWILINHGLFFREIYTLQLYCFQFRK